jgi:phage terminase large subunit GpA-like protein
MITIGVDVQKLGLYWVARGWSFNSESWRLGGGYIPGQTEYDGVWLLLTRIIEKDWNGMRARCVFVDSGYRPGDRDRRPDHMVYKYARQYAGLVWPTKGRDKLDAPLMGKKIDVTLSGKTHRGGLQLWHIDTDYYKSWLHSRINWPEGEPGGFHLERTCDDDYCKQMTAEEVLTMPSGRRVWRKLREDNHYLDCEVNAAAAASKMQVHTLPDLSIKVAEKKAPTTPSRRREQSPRQGIF